MTHHTVNTYGHNPHLQGRCKGDAREMQGSRQALSILNEYGKSMPGAWIRLALVLLMITVGLVEVKAQDTDYSGTYFIGSTNYNSAQTTTNYYLCPTENWYYYQSSSPFYLEHTDSPDNNNGMPFMTTYPCRNGSYTSSNAVWLIKKKAGEDYYYIIHVSSGKYLTYNDAYFSNTGRVRVHLEDYSSEKDDYALFAIEYIESTKTYDIISKYADVNDTYKDGGLERKYLNVNKGNQNSLVGTDADKTTPAYSGGIIGLWTKGSAGDSNSKWYLEDAMSAPVITQQDDNTIIISYPGSETVTLYYTTDDSRPDPTNAGGSNPTQIYEVGTTTITMSNPVTTVKAIAVKTAATGEAIDSYSRCATLTTQRYIGSSYSYKIESVECKDFYMIPGDVNKGNTEVNTSSLFRSTMAWTFFNAGSESGVQYYYIKNGENYLFRTNNNIYIRTSSVFDAAADKTGYMFFIEQGYDARSNPDGFVIVPKGITDKTYSIHKSGYSAGPPVVLANAKASVVQGGKDARGVERGRWNIIPYSAPGNVLSSSLVTSDDDNPLLFKIENVGTAGQYMSPPATGKVGTATLGNDALAWYIKEASSDTDSERKYYYIIHKKTGYYLKFNKPTTVNTIQSDVLDLCKYEVTESDRYQFVFAKSTIDGAYYIVPKGLENVSQNNYYALYLDGTNPIKSNNHRESNSSKWKLVPFCYNPVFEKDGGNITLTCTTTNAEIHYTNDGTEPDDKSTLYSSDSWLSSNQLRIKAIAVIKEDDVIVSTSEIVTLLNKPDVTLGSGPFTYKGTEHTPAVNSVSVSTTSAPKYPDPETYKITYSNNTNAGNASVIIEDLDPDDRWYIWNVPTTNFTIGKKMLTVTADNKTVEHGSPAPEYTVTITGFVNAEGPVVLKSRPTATSTYTTSSAVGSNFDITPSGGDDENYDFTYENGTLTVIAAFVTLTANSGTVTYSGTEQTVTGFTCSVDGLTFTGVSASGSGTDAGTYDVTFTGVTLNSTTDNTCQYVVTKIEYGTLTINPAAVTVTADDKTKTYGEADPALSATVTGLVNSESESLISYTLSRATGNNAGTYIITSTGEAPQGNYTVSYVPGTFTINKKDLTITANNHSIEYSNAPSNDGVTYSGFIDGENENTQGVFTGTLVYSYNSQADGKGTSYTTTIPKGTFYIIPGGLTATNYNITYNNGTLTVTEKSIGDGAIAPGFTLEFGNEGAIILKDGETQLIQTTDFTIGDETISTSGKYSSKTVSGTGNYTGSFSIRNAIVNFQTDDNGIEWSATFVAEKSGATDIGHALPDGIRAYIITGIDGSWAIPEELEYIPEGVPVLLVSNKASGGFLVENANSSDITPITEAQETNNMLKVVNADMEGYYDTDNESPNYQKVHFNVKTIYLLNYNEFVYNMDGYLSIGKVFLNPSHPDDPSFGVGGSSPAQMRLSINWDIVNGIKDIPDKGNAGKWNSGPWYGVDGKLLDGTPIRKGLYLHEGVKVMIK